LLQRGIQAESKRIGIRAGRESIGGTPSGRTSATPQLDGAPAAPDELVDEGGDYVDDSDVIPEPMSRAASTESERRGSSSVPASLDQSSAASAGGSSVDDEGRLALLRSAVSSGKTTPAGTESGALQIREDPQRGVFVAGAAQLPVTDARQVFEALSLGAMHRATAATRMNERSSRSHSVFQLYILQKRLTSMTTVRSTLTVVDLAGSERVSAGAVCAMEGKGSAALRRM
jgi:hypothetical protein